MATEGLTRAQVLSDVLAALEHWLVAPAVEVLAAWRERNVTLGQRVQVTAPAGKATLYRPLTWTPGVDRGTTRVPCRPFMPGTCNWSGNVLKIHDPGF